MYVFTQPLHHKQNVSQVYFEQNEAGLNLEVSFSQMCCKSKVKEPCLLYCLLLVEGIHSIF